MKSEKPILNMEVRSVLQSERGRKIKAKLFRRLKYCSTEIFHTYYPKPQEREKKINFLAGKLVEILQESGTLSLSSTKSFSPLGKGEK